MILKKTKISIAIIIIFSLIISIMINEYYLGVISQFSEPVHQSDMILDAYYYWQQGKIIFDQWGITSNIDVYHYNSPTLNSTGVVFIASVLSGVGLNAHTIPLFLGFIYFNLSLKKDFNPDKLPTLILLLSLCPLPFINSKEAYIYIASMIMYQAFYSFGLKSFLYFLFSLSLLFFARYEIVFILITAYFLMFIDSKFKLILTILILMSLFLIYKQNFLAGPIQLETYLSSINGLVFGGNNQYVLITSDENLIVIFGARFLCFIFLPIKWLLGIIDLFNKTLSSQDAINVLEQFLFVICYFTYFIFFLKLKKLRSMYSSLKEFRWLCNVVFLYLFYYGIFVFHQPTRQVIFILSIFLIYTSAIKNRNQRASLICQS